MRVKRHLFWVALYVAFVGAAYGLRSWMGQSGAAEIWGWDYQTFVGQIQDWRWIGYFGFRHPGLGLVCSPLVALEHVWNGAYLLVMPGVATATAWLIWKMGGRAGLAAWLTMPTTWLLAGTPESFPVAQLALVGSAWWQVGGQRSKVRGQMLEWMVVGGLAVVNSMITLTNGIKPLLGWVVANWKSLDQKALIRSGMAVAGLVLLGVGFFYVRTLMTGRGMGAGLEATFSWIPDERNLPRELYGFFIRPVGLYQSFVVYPLALLGVCQMVRKHQTSLLLVLASYFAVDIGIHVIVGWGMKEPWVFAPHWIWILAILAGRGWGEVGGSSKKVRIRLVKRVLPVAEIVLVRLSISR